MEVAPPQARHRTQIVGAVLRVPHVCTAVFTMEVQTTAVVVTQCAIGSMYARLVGRVVLQVVWSCRTNNATLLRVHGARHTALETMCSKTVASFREPVVMGRVASEPHTPRRKR